MHGCCWLKCISCRAASLRENSSQVRCKTSAESEILSRAPKQLRGAKYFQWACSCMLLVVTLAFIPPCYKKPLYFLIHPTLSFCVGKLLCILSSLLLWRDLWRHVGNVINLTIVPVLCLPLAKGNMVARENLSLLLGISIDYVTILPFASPTLCSLCTRKLKWRTYTGTVVCYSASAIWDRNGTLLPHCSVTSRLWKNCYGCWCNRYVFCTLGYFWYLLLLNCKTTGHQLLALAPQVWEPTRQKVLSPITRELTRKSFLPSIACHTACRSTWLSLTMRISRLMV